MMKSEELFRWAEAHPWIGNKLIPKLSIKDREFILNFLNENLEIPLDEMERKINRIYLDSPPESRSKRWKEILEILSNINSFRREQTEPSKMRRE